MRDQPALREAASAGDTVLPLFVLDPRIVDVATPRRDHLLASLRARRGHGRRPGRPPRLPEQVVAKVAEEARRRHRAHHRRVHALRTAPRPEGARAPERDGRSLVATGTPYAVGPGSVLKRDGTPFQVFTPFSKAWRDHGWPGPAPVPRAAWVRAVDGDGIPEGPEVEGAGEGLHGAAGSPGCSSTSAATTASATAPTSTPPAGCRSR